MKKDELRIIYEDRWLIAVEKPSGMLTPTYRRTVEGASSEIIL